MILNEEVDYKKVFLELEQELKNIDDSGEVASYIPEFVSVDPDKFGIHLMTTEKESFGFGDYDEKFSIQSISKVLALSMAFELEGEKLWSRVGVEPSGTPFNSLIQLEYEKGIPRNPFINAGTLVICDILVCRLKNPKTEFLEFVREISGNLDIYYSKKVAQSEKLTSYKNAALINLMKSYGNIKNDIDIVLDFIFLYVPSR